MSTSERFDTGHEWAHLERVVVLGMEVQWEEEQQVWKGKGMVFDAWWRNGGFDA